ncbi:dihydroorotase [Desulfobulbus propionicus DSM 2032]|uniref:Dihydroorotase n=1 Tax=Desulfobulbus propionicus (strain ATCC 33891 / DSM 2032 / VKM B-1956 / 1pr3) TaxID=577650 RepID=A0A7U3YPZ4_DESPD|nr:dihydroorotase [Desulfobulbus propionicus]ADW19283.1 dihydroorotase [Desulfobulbus propionicus DSM 2032]
MNTTWRIRNGRIIDPANSRDEIADLLVIDGRIGAPDQPVPPDVQELDASGCWVVPGLIDMHVHLREPGEEYKEDILSGARSAACGGFTGVACMPNTKPVNDNATVTAMILTRAREAAVRVHPVGAISLGSDGKQLAEFGEMRAAGVVAVSDDGRPVRDSQLMRRALEYASDFGLPVIAHSEEPSLSTGVMNEGPVSTLLGLKGIPTAAESIMVYREIALAEFTGARVHIAHVSTAMSIELIRAAKARGVRVTAETAPHYFTLTDEAVIGYDTNTKMNPPLRSAADREAIRTALADGTLDAIATDHAPHSILEKELEFDAAANGIIGLETALPLTLALVRDGVIDARRLVELLAVKPAAILGLPAGSLTPGLAADLTVIDPQREFVYTADQVMSKSRNTPFLGWTLQGRAVLTMVGGTIRHSLPA